eukprot:3607597-Pleurochrysis_carterae.AAC.1
MDIGTHQSAKLLLLIIPAPCLFFAVHKEVILPIWPVQEDRNLRELVYITGLFNHTVNQA